MSCLKLKFIFNPYSVIQNLNMKRFQLNYKNTCYFTVASKIPKNKLDLSPELILGRGMTLACPAVGNPVPSITWYKDDQPIDFSLPSPYKTTSQGRQLHILSARESAVFRCHASNIAGDDEIEFDLQVLCMFYRQNIVCAKFK